MYYIAVVFSLLIGNAFAEEHQDVKTKVSALNIPYVNLQAKIDGDIDDAIWDNALSIPMAIVNNPWNNLPSPVTTEAKVIENGEFLYIAFIANDPSPKDIQGFLGDRDTKWGDDLVGIKLDTMNNRRLNYEFFVNPFGVQNDGIQNEMTGESNDLWDGIWQSYGKITDQGYQVEIAIPYHILNFEQNSDIKTWSMELVRLYPRETRLRISHVPLDRDNACWLCQYPEIKGFKHAKIGSNLMLTPSLVANKSQSRDIYDSQDNWHDDNDIDAGLDLRWGINPNTLLNVTLNPDFSTVESDSGQLSVNKTFSLFYDEKRPFFLDNAEYFSSNFNLVYTRNIADPDFGTKLTGTKNQHTYGLFVTNDTQTNFIVPGNTGSDLASLKSNSHSAVFKYRYDINDDFSIGAISTLRDADNYHNYVSAIDAKYRIDESNSLLAQVLGSNTLYPSDISDHLTNYNQEQILRTQHLDDFSDQAMKIDFVHASEYWQVNVNHQQIGKDFRADLGYMPKADFKQDEILVDRLFYGDEHSFWQEARLSGQWYIEHNQAGELLERTVATSLGFDGPKLSYFDFMLVSADKVGLRQDSSNLSIDNNTSRFTENQFTFSTNAQPTSRLYAALDFTVGDKIDYSNNRLGDVQEFSANLTYNATNHLEIDLYVTHSQLEVANKYVYKANLTELRVSYQFDVQSYLKLNLVYSDVDRNPSNNPRIDASQKNRNLSTQLIYAYKLNPQTVFFLGYSDNSYQDDYLQNLEREERTFFTKISYAWMP